MAARKRQEEKSEASVAAILEAGLALFASQGYRATNMRQIAERAGLSVGNIYHHFPNKHAIYQRLIERYWERLLDPELPLNRVFAAGRFPDDLEEMAAAIEQVVAANADHILLIYVDVIEFRGEHIRAFYEGMAKRFDESYRRPFEERQRAGDFGEADPMMAVMVAARWLFYFFTVERCFGAPMHFGMTPKEAVDGFIRLVRAGLAPTASGQVGSVDALEKTQPKARKSAARPKGGIP